MAVNKGHKQINRDILVENRHYKTKNITGFFNWSRTQNVTGRSILSKFKSCIFVFCFFVIFPKSDIYTPTKMVCEGKQSYTISCILNYSGKQLLKQ